MAAKTREAQKGGNAAKTTPQRWNVEGDLARGTEAPPLANRLSFLVHEISARIASWGNRHFRDHGLNHFSARILILLLENGDLRTGELVDRMVLPQSTISTQLIALQKKHLIKRRRSRQDNRSVIVSLTAAGLELAKACNELSLRTQSALLSDISAQETEAALRFLRKMASRLIELESKELFPFRRVDEVQKLVDAESESKKRKTA